jgi:inner membrane protein
MNNGGYCKGPGPWRFGAGEDKIAFMDPIAHTLAGTLLGRSQPSRKKGLVLACVFGALVPDIDIVLTLWGREFYMTEHRGFTHSLLGFIPVSLLAAWVAWFFTRKKSDRAPFGWILGMAMVGVLSHLYLDWCTSWGTMLLWPNRERFSGDSLFIVDLWYTALLAVPILASAFFKKHRAKICAIGILLAAGYHVMAVHNHSRALGVAAQDRPQAWRAAFPQPFSPYRWSAFNRQDRLLRHARIDFLLGPGALEWKEYQDPPLTPDLQAAMDSPEGKQFLWFSRVPYWEVASLPDGTQEIDCWDLRFYAYAFQNQTRRSFGKRFIVKDGKVLKAE